MAFTNDWTETTPLGSENANTADDYLRNAKVDLGERLEPMFYGFNHDDHADEEDEFGVKHLKFFPEAADPTTDSDYGFIYVKSDGSTDELFWKDESGNVKQLTDGGILKVVAGDYAADSIDADDIRLANNTYLTVRNYAGDGDINCIKVNASDVPEILVGAVLSADTAPGSGPAIANRKYVDDHVGHDGDGYVLVDVDGTPTKVYTKYLTGTLDADAATDVAHGVTGVDNILAVNAVVYNSSLSLYMALELWRSAESIGACWISYDGTNIKFQNVGSNLQGQKYRIGVAYVV